ncbi:hypothetical protein PVAND_016572 [Polypedilum vanderplanki]|uniref:Alkylglycerone-phosphate synthase n=1 Tax=Polypedilum vanderplanki TaxID=319348 RepID=A0A9J6BFT5_POLVA|nr:hypothetical protein PVAND_016572 [Polypedilum vanderplanki]
MSNQNIFPKRRQELVKPNGWGYCDAYLYYDKTKNSLMFHGKRYPRVGSKPLTRALEGFKNVFSIDISEFNSDKFQTPSSIDYPIKENQKFFESIKELNIDHSMNFEDRFYRGHSQSSTDIYNSMFGKFPKIPDIVVWPKNHEEVAEIVNLANELNIGLIPVGGLSNVTGATQCPSTENRTICSLDLTQMFQMLWLDDKSMLACFEAGISGQDLERVLNERGFTMGHSPDSIEFSTLGGWIATKSSGMKQQTYGNIEDIVVKVKLVTSIGVLEHNSTTPRSSAGPDFEQLIIGSEGTLGVITQAVVKIHKLPESTKYAAFIFPDIHCGIKFLKECSRSESLPSNMRLFCNSNVKAGLMLEETDTISNFIHPIKLFFIKNVLRFDLDKFTSASYMIEGDQATVEWKDKNLRKIASKYGAFYVGENVARHSYMSSSVYSVYLRDLIFNLGALVDTVETSITWNNLENCIANIKTKYENELKRLNLKGFILYRISQVYHEGCCLYTYYGLNKCENQLETFKKLTDFIKNVILESGGSLSHHHGIGAKNTLRYDENMPKIKKEMLRCIKEKVDPKNVFCVRNFIPEKIQSKL